MGESGDRENSEAAALVDELVAQGRVLAKAQARHAALMLEFSDIRRRCDHRVIADREAAGCDPRYRPAEFAAMEIGRVRLCCSDYAAARGMTLLV